MDADSEICEINTALSYNLKFFEEQRFHGMEIHIFMNYDKISNYKNTNKNS